MNEEADFFLKRHKKDDIKALEDRCRAFAESKGLTVHWIRIDDDKCGFEMAFERRNV